MATNRLLFGLEVECEYDSSKVSIERGSYHAGMKVGRYWFSETDGSLSTTAKFGRNGRTVELVSVPFKLKQFDKVMAELKEKIFQNKPMAEVMNINNTCGNHIHVSAYTYHGGKKKGAQLLINHGSNRRKLKGITPRQLPLSMKAIETIREEVQQFMPAQARARYFRHYAMKTTSKTYGNGSKYSEWNVINDTHAEFRSFNLVGIDKWDDFIMAYRKTLECINKNILKNPVTETKNINCDRLVTEKKDEKVVLNIVNCLPESQVIVTRREENESFVITTRGDI